MAVMEGLHLTSLLAGALVAGLPAVLLVLKLRRDLRRLIVERKANGSRHLKCR